MIIKARNQTMSLATQRLIIPITAADKKAVEAKAAKLGRNMTAEFVRRAVLAYDPDEAADEEELRTLIASFAAIHAATLAQLDRTDAALDRALSQPAGSAS
jgi:hypothetical protein